MSRPVESVPVIECMECGDERVITDAQEVMAFLGGERPVCVETDDGYDLEIGGIEVGSYGVREHPEFGQWVYGTGLALPRFSVASAIAVVI